MTATSAKSVRMPSRLAPLLENGDHLSAVEFERRYEAMPDLKHAELVEGIVYMNAAVSAEFHGDPHADLMGWLFLYRARTPGVRVSDNATLRLDDDNVFQPDASLRLPEHVKGRARLDELGYLEGPTELVAEVAGSTASIDLNTKLDVYRRHGVREYIVWRVRDDAIDWFVWKSGGYQRLALQDGLYRSEVFPGLWLDAVAMNRGDAARVVDALSLGLATPEHAAFARSLHVSDKPT